MDYKLSFVSIAGVQNCSKKHLIWKNQELYQENNCHEVHSNKNGKVTDILLRFSLRI